MSKIYFDTTPLICFLDDEKPFSDKVAQFILTHQDEDDFYVTSSITDTEYLVFPYRTNDAVKIQAYDSFLNDFVFQIIEPNRKITHMAAQIRARYPGAKAWIPFTLQPAYIATAAFFLQMTAN